MAEEVITDEKKEPLEQAVPAGEEPGAAATAGIQDAEKMKAELEELNDKYLRLYAEFENYKKRVRKEREEFFNYCNEDLLYELLPVIDNLDMALKHTSEGNADALQSLKKGVENTFRELNRILEKFGLKAIESEGRLFDPAVHHAMSHVARPDTEGNIVLEEMRKGYIYKDKVLRPSLVSVSKKT